MSWLPHACIPLLVLLYVGTFVVTDLTSRRALRRYFREVKRFCRELGLRVFDAPGEPGRFVIEGALDGVSLRVGPARVELDDEHGESGYRPLLQVALEAAGEPSWVAHTPLQTQSQQHITSPRLPGARWPTVLTGDTRFDRRLELRVADGTLPAFARIEWLRRVLLEAHLELAVSHEGRTVVGFLEREVRDGPFDLHLLRRRVFAALALADPGRAERHRVLLLAPPPAPVDWSLVPLTAMFLSLAPAVAGTVLLDFPASWMGAVVGATAGYPAALLAALLATWLWIRRAQRRAAWA